MAENAQLMNRKTVITIAVLVVLLASWVLGNIIYLFPHVLGAEQSHGFASPGTEEEGTTGGGLSRNFIVLFMVVAMGAAASLLYLHGEKEASGLVSLILGSAALGVLYKFALVHYMAFFMAFLIGGAIVGFIFTGKRYWESNIVAQTLVISGFMFVLLVGPKLIPFFPSVGGAANIDPFSLPVEGLKAADAAVGGNSGLLVLGVIGLGFLSLAGYNLLGRFIDLRRDEGEEEIKEDISETVDRAIEDLHKGKDVRSTVLRCYQKMALILETSGGVHLEESMTPREFKIESTKRLDVSKDVISDLTQLFEEGRYSSHRLGEGERKKALSDLKALREQMGM